MRTRLAVVGLASLLLIPPQVGVGQAAPDEDSGSPSTTMLNATGTAMSAASNPGATHYGLQLRDEKGNPSLARNGSIKVAIGFPLAIGGVIAGAIGGPRVWGIAIGVIGTGLVPAFWGLWDWMRYADQSGVWIDQVSAGGAATRAGLEPGDKIIKVNGDDVRNAAQVEAKLLLSQDQAGPLTFAIMRDGRNRQIAIDRPVDCPSNQAGVADALDRIRE
ncbi:MAG: PDZ domain-containing protein [Planctomycetes bacterium]|nr:PDZ domain-containing protein [Planctomycetota bacterium]